MMIGESEKAATISDKSHDSSKAGPVGAQKKRKKETKKERLVREKSEEAAANSFQDPMSSGMPGAPSMAAATTAVAVVAVVKNEKVKPPRKRAKAK